MVHVQCPCTKGMAKNVNSVNSNSRGIGVLSLVGKLFRGVLIKRVRAGTKCAIGEEQCELRRNRGCIFQVFTVRQVFEMYLANGRDVF